MVRGILVLTTTFPRWKNDSTPAFVYELAKQLARDFNINLVAPHFRSSREREIVDKINVYRFRYSKKERLCYEGGMLSNIKKNKKLMFQVPSLVWNMFKTSSKIIKRKKISLIHAHWILPSGLVALWLKRLYNIPYIITVHGSDIHSTGYKSLKKSILKEASVVNVVSNGLKKEVLKLVPNANVIVCSMGIHVNQFQVKKNKNKNPVLLFVGRLTPEKGTIILIKAMANVIREYKKTKLLIIGDGISKNRLINLTKMFGLWRNISFLGAKPHKKLSEYYSDADIFILPSLREGFGLTLLEAMAAKVPVIGSKISGISEIIQDNKQGLLFEKANSAILSNKIISLLKDKKLKNKLIKNGSRFVKNYDWKVIADKFKKIYLGLK